MWHDKGSRARPPWSSTIDSWYSPSFPLRKHTARPRKKSCWEWTARAEVTREKGVSFTNLFYREGVRRSLETPSPVNANYDLRQSGNLFRMPTLDACFLSYYEAKGSTFFDLCRFKSTNARSFVLFWWRVRIHREWSIIWENFVLLLRLMS